MNYSLIILEIAVVALGLGVLLADLWTPLLEQKRQLGYFAAIGLGLILIYSFKLDVTNDTQRAFHGMYILDTQALFFKRFFLIAALIVMVMAVEFSDRIEHGISEFYALILFALSGMMFAASANDFSMLFVSIELITVTFYILTSFQRGRLVSLEAGVKYLILGALSSAFMVYGIALIFGITGKLNFDEIGHMVNQVEGNKIFLMGVLLVLVGLGFKMAIFPVQMWAPDVYQGSPTPATAFLAVGSKAAGFALLIRVLSVIPSNVKYIYGLLVGIAMITILYGNLCAIPQRNLKRLMGYSSISNAGYLMLGIAAFNPAGRVAILYYLGSYLFTVLAAFMVICLVMRKLETEDITALAGLNQRSPLLAATLTMAMVSLAGIPPLAGFFGKFLLLKAVVERGDLQPVFYWLAGVTLVGVVISIYYYFGVIRAIYWSKDAPDLSPIKISLPARVLIYGCVLGMLWLGLFPNALVNWSNAAVGIKLSAIHL